MKATLLITIAVVVVASIWLLARHRDLPPRQLGDAPGVDALAAPPSAGSDLPAPAKAAGREVVSRTDATPSEASPDGGVIRRFGFRPDPRWSADIRQIRETAWHRLEDFRAAAQLDDTTWQRFLGDVADLVDSYDVSQQDRTTSIAEKENMSDQLGVELQDRIATYLLPSQLEAFRARFDGFEVIIIANGTLQAIEDDPRSP